MPQLVLVDDSTTIQKIVELAFAPEDVDVSSFADPAEALDHLVLEGADVVLADISLPGVDGYELCRRIRLSPRLTSVPVVLLAGTFEPFDVQLAEESGYSGSLTKPFEAAQLVALVGDLLSTSAAENGSAPPDSPAEVEGPLFFEIPVQEASEPLFELSRTSAAPNPPVWPARPPEADLARRPPNWSA